MISLIVAVSDNHVIGSANRLPWNCPVDLYHFKTVTYGHAIIMGRKTFESMGGRKLPGREMIVISRNPDYRAPTFAHTVQSINDAIERARLCGDTDPFIIGGSQIYQEALSIVDRLHITRIHKTVDGDAFFNPDLTGWNLRHEEDTVQLHPERIELTFQIFDRVDLEKLI